MNAQSEALKLHQAVISGDLEQVQLLIEAGANINAVNSNYDTPLKLAVTHDHPKIFQVLLDAGAIPDGWTLDLIITNLDESSNLKVLGMLLRSGLDANIRLEDGETLLMQAAQQGNFQAVKTLLEAGADPNGVSRQSSFALIAAGYACHQEVFEYLIPLTSSELKVKAANQLPTRFAKLIAKVDF